MNILGNRFHGCPGGGNSEVQMEKKYSNLHYIGQVLKLPTLRDPTEGDPTHQEIDQILTILQKNTFILFSV